MARLNISFRQPVKALFSNLSYRITSRRHKSSEDAKEKIKGVPTKEELRSSGSLLHDTLQRTGDYSQTDIKMLSQEEGEKVYILRYGVTGFKLQGGIRIVGPMAVFPRSILHWNIRDSDDINVESLSLFTLLYPKPDILVLGVGDPGRKVSPDVFKYLRSKRINVEILPTDMACATFNFLNSEHRYVVGGMIPPAEMLSDFDRSFMSTDSFLIDSPKLKQPPDPDDLTREAKYIQGNLIPRMFGKTPKYQDPELAEQEKHKNRAAGSVTKEKQETEYNDLRLRKQNRDENKNDETYGGKNEEDKR